MMILGSMRGWTAGPGDWVVRGGRMVQQDAGEPLARADRMVTQQGEYELEFSIRYVDGGYSSMSDMQNGIYHAGFGIQIGVENPALGRSSWGAGNSYLLWLNLDTRPSTRAKPSRALRLPRSGLQERQQHRHVPGPRSAPGA